MKLYISETQGVASVVNQLSRVKERSIELIFPDQAAFFNDPENLQLLKNQETLLGKDVSISSPNEYYVQLAQRVGISAQKEETNPLANEEPTTQEKLNSSDNLSSQEIEDDYLEKEGKNEGEFTKRYFDLGRPVELPQVVEKAKQEDSEPDFMPVDNPLQDQSKESKPTQKEELPLFEPDQPAQKTTTTTIEEDLKAANKRLSKANVAKVGTLSVLAIAAAFLYFYLPQASIQLFAQRQKISFSFDINAQKTASVADSEKHIVPAQFIEITKESSLPFEIKQKTSSTQKASGHIMVYNQNSAAQFMVPSRFQSSNDNIYWSQRNISVPAKSSLDIEIVADKPGSTFNLSCTQKQPCDFTVPAWKGSDNYSKVYGKGTQAISGGSSGQGYVVANEEFQTAQTNLRSQLNDQIQKELATRIPAGYTLLTDSNRSDLSDVTSTPQPNMISPDGKATVQGKMVFSSFAVKEADIKDLVNKLVKNQLDSDKSPKPDTIKLDYKVMNVDTQTGSVALTINTSEEVTYAINTEDLKNKLIGKTEEEVRKILGDLPKVQSAQVTLWPFWVRSIPTRRDKVEIDVK